MVKQFRNLLQALWGLAFGLLLKKNTTALSLRGIFSSSQSHQLLSFPMSANHQFLFLSNLILTSPQQWPLLLFSPDHHLPLPFSKHFPKFRTGWPPVPPPSSLASCLSSLWQTQHHHHPLLGESASVLSENHLLMSLSSGRLQLFEMGIPVGFRESTLS